MNSPNKHRSRLSLAYKKSDGAGASTSSAASTKPQSTMKTNQPTQNMPKLGICGLLNLGNTCYLNSVLQVLRYTPHFLHQLKTLKYHLYLSEKFKRQQQTSTDKEAGEAPSDDVNLDIEVVKSLHNLFERMKKHELKAPEDNCDLIMDRPNQLLSLIRKLNPMFEGYMQHDAQEFLRCLLCYVQDAEAKIDPSITNGNHVTSSTSCMDATSSTDTVLGESNSERTQSSASHSGTLFKYFKPASKSSEKVSSKDFNSGRNSDSRSQMIDVCQSNSDRILENGASKSLDGNINVCSSTGGLNISAEDDSKVTFSTNHSENTSQPNEVLEKFDKYCDEGNTVDKIIGGKKNNKKHEKSRKFIQVKCLEGSNSESNLKNVKIRKVSMDDLESVQYSRSDTEHGAGARKRLSLSELDENSLDGTSPSEKIYVNDSKNKRRALSDGGASAKKRKTSKSNENLNVENTKPNDKTYRSRLSTSNVVIKENNSQNGMSKPLVTSVSDIFPKKVKRLGTNGPTINCTLVKYSKFDEDSLAAGKIKPIFSFVDPNIYEKTIFNGVSVKSDIETKNENNSASTKTQTRCNFVTPVKTRAKTQSDSQKSQSNNRTKSRKSSHKFVSPWKTEASDKMNTSETTSKSVKPGEMKFLLPADDEMEENVEAKIESVEVKTESNSITETECKNEGLQNETCNKNEGLQNETCSKNEGLQNETRGKNDCLQNETCIKNEGLQNETCSKNESLQNEMCNQNEGLQNENERVVENGTGKISFYSPKKLKLPKDEENEGASTSTDSYSQTHKKPDLVERVFAGTMMLCTRCNNCETTSSRTEPFHDVSVPIHTRSNQSDAKDGSPDKDASDSDEEEESNDGLSRLMSAFSETEHLREDNKYFCGQCLAYMEAERSIKYNQLPQILTLHLKRFSTTLTGNQMSKINDHITTSLTLPCLRYDCDPPCTLPHHTYSLYAVISHSGVSITSGHYTAYVRVDNSSYHNRVISNYKQQSANQSQAMDTEPKCEPQTTSIMKYFTSKSSKSKNDVSKSATSTSQNCKSENSKTEISNTETVTSGFSQCTMSKGDTRPCEPTTSGLSHKKNRQSGSISETETSIKNETESCVTLNAECKTEIVANSCSVTNSVKYESVENIASKSDIENKSSIDDNSHNSNNNSLSEELCNCEDNSHSTVAIKKEDCSNCQKNVILSTKNLDLRKSSRTPKPSLKLLENRNSLNKPTSNSASQVTISSTKSNSDDNMGTLSYSATDDWLKCDDESVTLLSAEQFQNLLGDCSSTECSPYVLFYASNSIH